MKANVKFEKELKQTKTLLVQFRLVISYQPACLQKYFPRTGTMADSVSTRTNTITSRDRIKPIGIGENLVVNLVVNYG